MSTNYPKITITIQILSGDTYIIKLDLYETVLDLKNKLKVSTDGLFTPLFTQLVLIDSNSEEHVILDNAEHILSYFPIQTTDDIIVIPRQINIMAINTKELNSIYSIVELKINGVPHKVPIYHFDRILTEEIIRKRAIQQEQNIVIFREASAMALRENPNALFIASMIIGDPLAYNRHFIKHYILTDTSYTLPEDYIIYEMDLSSK